MIHTLMETLRIVFTVIGCILGLFLGAALSGLAMYAGRNK